MALLSSRAGLRFLGRSLPQTQQSAPMEEFASSAAFEEQCTKAVHYSLANFLHDQACFFAERLVSERPSKDSLDLLASSYLRCGRPGRAYVLLQEKRPTEPRLRYLLALCCFKLEKYDEAERVLTNLPGNKSAVNSLPGREVLGDVAGGAAGLYLLGQVKEKLARPDRISCAEQAIECYAKCLELCPFMWCAFERLSWLILGVPSATLGSGLSAVAQATVAEGPGAFASAYFNDEKFDSNPILQHSDTSVVDGLPQSAQRSSALKQNQRLHDTGGDAATAVRKRRRNDAASPAKYNGEGGSVILTPMQSTSLQGSRTPLADRSGLAAPPQSPVPARSPVSASLAAPASMLFQTPVELLSRLSPRKLLSFPYSPGPASPIDNRCHSNSLSNVVGAACGPDSTADAGVPCNFPGEQEQSLMVGTQRSENVVASCRWTLALFMRIMGEGVHALHCFDCQRALKALQKLPVRHRNSGFVQDLTARCHFEAADYRQAIIVYAKCCEDNQLHKPLGLEYYSTALWHLREAVNLGCLARRVLAWDRSWPQVWCVVGNCFSLQNDHEQAIRCFRRAVQLDPSLTYAYTLIGHEYVELEKLDNAKEMYERALHIDARHYNAWWGLGNVHFRQEEFKAARYHFQKAVDINGENAVLRITLGEACVACADTQKALELFSIAAQKPNGSAPACYQKGCLLASQMRYEEAIAELKRAQMLAPREPKIKYQLGLAFQGLGDAQNAMCCYTMAMDLCGRDSKDHQVILQAQSALSVGMSDNAREQPEMDTPGTPVNAARPRRRGCGSSY